MHKAGLRPPEIDLPLPIVSHEAQMKLTLEDIWAHTALPCPYITKNHVQPSQALTISGNIRLAHTSMVHCPLYPIALLSDWVSILVDQCPCFMITHYGHSCLLFKYTKLLLDPTRSCQCLVFFVFTKHQSKPNNLKNNVKVYVKFL